MSRKLYRCIASSLRNLNSVCPPSFTASRTGSQVFYCVSFVCLKNCSKFNDIRLLAWTIAVNMAQFFFQSCFVSVSVLRRVAWPGLIGSAMTIIRGQCHGLQFLFCYSPNIYVKEMCCASRAALSRIHRGQWRMCFLCTLLLLFLVSSITNAWENPGAPPPLLKKVILVWLQQLACQCSCRKNAQRRPAIWSLVKP